MPWSTICLILALMSFVVVAVGFDHPRFNSLRILAIGLAFATLSVVIVNV